MRALEHGGAGNLKWNWVWVEFSDTIWAEGRKESLVDRLLIIEIEDDGVARNEVLRE